MVAIPVASIYIRDNYLQYTNFPSQNDKKQVVASPVISVHILRKKEEIERVSVLTKLPSSLVP